jgi:tRNA(Ile)-lysidine synthase
MDNSTIWLDRLARRVRQLRDRLGPRWVVAVSGGGDSVALLRALQETGLELSVAHLDHGARGVAGEEDARFVAELAERLGLPFDLGHWSPERAAHFEADARRARYAWLAEVARSRGASAVAVGHNRDDQAETILHRVLRGTGPRGLAGMPRTRLLADGVTLVRPLLGVGRVELRAYLESLGQPWREDATNVDLDRTRARVRHDLLPRLAREVNPSVAEALVRLGTLTRRAVAALDEYVKLLASNAIRPGPAGTVALDRAALAALSPHLQTEVLRSLWRDRGWPEAAMDARRWIRIAAWATHGVASRDLGAGVRGEVRGGHLILTKTQESVDIPIPAPVPLAIPGAVDWRGRRIVASLDEPSGTVERLDLDRLIPPLSVDAPRPGDRFDPLGLEGRTMPLADFFRGRHVPRSQRSGVPVVRDALGIVWVVGHRIGHRARITEGTTRVLSLRFEDHSDPIATC